MCVSQGVPTEERNKDNAEDSVCFLVSMEKQKEVLFTSCPLSFQGPNTAALQPSDRGWQWEPDIFPSFHKTQALWLVNVLSFRVCVTGCWCYWTLGPGTGRVEMRWGCHQVRGWGGGCVCKILFSTL